jgi:tetratricopeptide (TPR) repeat protein
MSPKPSWYLCGLILAFGMWAAAWGQVVEDQPRLAEPRTPPSAAEINRREAARLYGLGMLHERANRLIEAVRAYEQAERLDPESASISRALFSLYSALERNNDALDACRKVLRLDPEDYHTAYLFARKLRLQDRKPEALEVLRKAITSPRLKERPDLAAQIWFDQGLLLEQLGDTQQAENCIRKVVEILEQPDRILEVGKYSRDELASQMAETCERLGQLCLRNNRFEQAVAAFEKAKKADPLRGPRLAFHLAQVCRDRGKYAEALAHVSTYLRSQPASVEGYELRIELQKRLGRHHDILPSLEQSSARDPNNEALKLLLGRELTAAGRYEEAQDLYQKMLEQHLTPEVYKGLFAVYKQRGQRGAQEILKCLDEAIRAATPDEESSRPADTGAARRARAMLTVLRQESDLVRFILPESLRQVGPGQLSYATRSVLATLAARSREAAFAEQLYRACMDRPGGLGQLEAEVYVGLLRVLRYQGKHAAVLEVCRQGLREAHQTSRTLFHTEMIRAHQALNDHAAALAAADKAVNEAGGKEQILMCQRIRIDALVQAGQAERALQECQSLLKTYNQGSALREVRATLSSVYQALGKLDEAEHQLELILERDPNDATANNDLGYLWADRNKKLPEAERLIRKALELDRQQRGSGLSIDPDADLDNAAYTDSLGWVLFRRGKLQEACKELQRASTMPGGEDDPVIWDHLGDVYFRLKQPEQARQAWQKAIALYEQGVRRKSDGRYKDIQDKLRLVKP